MEELQPLFLSCSSQNPAEAFGLGVYLKGQGDFLSGLVMGVSRVTIWVIGGY